MCVSMCPSLSCAPSQAALAVPHKPALWVFSRLSHSYGGVLSLLRHASDDLMGADLAEMFSFSLDTDQEFMSRRRGNCQTQTKEIRCQLLIAVSVNLKGPTFSLLFQVIFALNQTHLQQESPRAGNLQIPCMTEDLIEHYNCGDLSSVIFSHDSSQVRAFVLCPAQHAFKYKNKDITCLYWTSVYKGTRP